MPLSCPMHDEAAFGPVVAAVPACYNGFDFTLLFEEIFFSLVPNVILTILLISRVFQLLRRRPCASTSKRLDQYWIKQTARITFILINFVKLFVLCLLAPRTPLSIPAAVVSLFVAICVPFLTHLEHYRSPRPASLLSLYLGHVLLFDIVCTRTLWIIQDNRPFAITFSVGVGVHLALFLAINICSDAATTDQKLPRETRANVYTRGLFWWLNPLFWLGFKTILDVPHPPAIDTGLRSRDFFEKLGDGLIGATAFIYIGLAIANANAQHKTYRVITKLRGTLVSLIYTKTLTVSVPTAQKGSPITLMSADVERTATELRFMHECWASCIDIGLGIYLLELQLEPTSVAPGVLFLLCSVVGLEVAASMGQRQRLWLEAIEKLIKATSNALAAAKEVRMGGLQVVMENKLRELRQEEIKASRKFKNALALIVCLSYTTAAMGPVLSFGIYSLLAKRNNTKHVTSEIGFTALSIFSLLRTPMAMILDAISGLVAATSAIQRIGKYLPADSHRRPLSPLTSATLSINTKKDAWSPVSESKDVITAALFSAGWSKEQGFIVQDATFSITPGSLTFIVGPYGLVLDACALRDDIARLPNGDYEIVDDGGSNLSGEDTIFTSLLGPDGLLRKNGKTVIFATNALHRLSLADHIIVLTADGTIAEEGPYSKPGSSASAYVQAGKKEVEHNDYKAMTLSILIETQTATEVKGQQRRTGDFTIYK
ncbi:hypothetical protein EJ02DRAFT_470428 [Clathrospora elynae]|uniref:ABC transmembrane type-1 domain-containing protein n=1 Tax=Clathrospora elynae TaxID=706981 RepID=A0A6A5SAG1_9PLEO|nr:hypothetical protein EJ02DRAFT_470428 [Clathrospora elynae]